MRYERVSSLAVRLLAGETIEHVDEHGRHWRATRNALLLVLPGNGESAAILEGVDAFEIATKLAALRSSEKHRVPAKEFRK